MRVKVSKYIVLALLFTSILSCQDGSKVRTTKPVVVNQSLLGSPGTESAVESGGDHAGNGGFAYEKPYELLGKASQEIISKIEQSNHPMFDGFPNRKDTLLKVLSFANLLQLPTVDGVYRAGKLLALDYTLAPNDSVKIYKPFYDRFAGVLESAMEEAQKEVEILLVHEAAHLWGYGDVDARAFAREVLSPDDFIIYPVHAVTPLKITTIMQYGCSSRFLVTQEMTNSIINKINNVFVGYDSNGSQIFQKQVFPELNPLYFEGAESLVGQYYYNNVSEYFYFPAFARPMSVPGIFSDKFFCHNVKELGFPDRPVYKRLAEQELFNLWSNLDVHFGESLIGYPDINEDIKSLSSVNIELFDRLRTKKVKNIFGNNELTLGVFLRPFIDDQSIAFCPTSTHYQSNDKLMNVLGRYIGDTEALYFAQDEEDSNKGLYIPESKIKEIRFYINYNTSQAIKPNGYEDLASNTIFFYWPIDNNSSPLEQGKNQKLYRVSYPSESIGYEEFFGELPATSDKRIGCIPK